jgi:hypothetical protein
MLLQHQSSRPTASPTHGRIPFFHVRPPCDTDLSNIKKDVPALRSRSKNKGRASPVPHKPTTRYPGHAHSHVRLHLDNSSILHHQRYLGQPFSSHPHEKANAFATEAKKGGKIGKDPKEGEGGVDGQLCLASEPGPACVLPCQCKGRGGGRSRVSFALRPNPTLRACCHASAKAGGGEVEGQLCLAS